MTEKIAVIVLFLLFAGTANSQSDTTNRDDENIVIIDGVVTTNLIWNPGIYNYYITNSIAFVPSESKPSFLISFSTTHNKEVYYGLRGGMYNYRKDLNTAVNEFLESLGTYSAGTYNIQGEFATTQNPTYIGSLYGSYYLSRELSLNAGFGFKYYKEQTYYGDLTFGIPSTGYPPKVNITPLNSFYVAKTKEVIRAYYSLGMDYNFERYRMGIYGDNLYSIGINFGIGFY